MTPIPLLQIVVTPIVLWDSLKPQSHQKQQQRGCSAADHDHLSQWVFEKRLRNVKPRRFVKTCFCSSVASASIEANRITEAGSQWPENTVDLFVFRHKRQCGVFSSSMCCIRLWSVTYQFQQCSVRPSNNKAICTLNLKIEWTKCSYTLYDKSWVYYSLQNYLGCGVILQSLREPVQPLH